VPLSEISDPEERLQSELARYIDSSEPEDLQDIDAHLRGGIPDRDLDLLNRYWQVLPAARHVLFESAGRPGYSRLKVAVADTKKAILSHPEFTAFKDTTTALFEKWRTVAAPRLRKIKLGDSPKALIEGLSRICWKCFVLRRC